MNIHININKENKSIFFVDFSAVLRDGYVIFWLPGFVSAKISGITDPGQYWIYQPKNVKSNLLLSKCNQKGRLLKKFLSLNGFIKFYPKHKQKKEKKFEIVLLLKKIS